MFEGSSSGKSTDLSLSSLQFISTTCNMFVAAAGGSCFWHQPSGQVLEVDDDQR